MSTIKNLWNSILQTIGTATTNFGGLVTVQTPSINDNSTNVATTEYVQNQNYLSRVTGTSPFIQAFNAYVDFSKVSNGVATITFPTPFKDGTVPFVCVTSTQEVDSGSVDIVMTIGSKENSDGTYSLDISNTEFTVRGREDWGSGTNADGQNYIPVLAIGEV